MSKYSFNKLTEIEQAIQNLLKNEKRDYSRELVFTLRYNLKQIREAKELISEDFKSLSEDESFKYQEFKQKQLEVVRNNNGQASLEDGNIQIHNWNQLSGDEREMIEKEMKEVTDEYSDLLDRVDEIMKNNMKHQREEMAEVDFRNVTIDMFPEELSGPELPDEFLEFIDFE